MGNQVKVEVRHGRSIIVFASREELHDFAVKRWAMVAAQAVSERAQVTVALSGGRTPVDFYKRLSEAKGSFDWERMHIFLVDERFVPDTDQESNYGLIKEMLLDRVPIPARNMHAVFTDMPDPTIAAAEYEKELLASFRAAPGQIPVFDIVMLGIGDDGHTASLFPGTAAISETRRLVTAVPAVRGRLARVTLTFAVINAARNVIFFVTGRAKAEVLRRVVEEEDVSLPATSVHPGGELLFLCDDEAASMLGAGKL